MIHDDLIEVIGLPLREFHFIWTWMHGFKYLTNDEALFTWLMIRNVFWVGKKSFAVELVASPECIWGEGNGSVH